jgi:hypothetical protein
VSNETETYSAKREAFVQAGLGRLTRAPLESIFDWLYGRDLVERFEGKQRFDEIAKGDPTAVAALEFLRQGGDELAIAQRTPDGDRDELGVLR